MLGMKKRVLHLIASNFVGGPERQILAHAREADSADWEIWVGSFRDGAERGELLRTADQQGLPTVEILADSRFNPLAVAELVEALQTHRVDLLCTHGYKANILGWLASRLSDCPQIAFLRGWTAETWNVRLYERLERMILRHLPWVACVSQAQARALSEGRRNRRPPVVVPNAVLFPFAKPLDPTERQRLRQRLGLPEKVFLVGAAGRLSVEKGHRFLLQAAVEITKCIPESHFVILGEGRERPHLEAQCAELGLRQQVTFAGFQKDIGPWIQAMDVLVNPSLSEGTPNVLLESMALGTPVVATAVGGVPDLVRDQQDGVLVAPGHPAALAAAVIDVCRQPDTAERLAQSAQERVKENSPSRQQQHLYDLYLETLGGAVAFPDTSLASYHRQLPMISVIVPVRNEEAHLGDVLEDLLRQQYPPEKYEILVADGNSTDGSASIVERYARQGAVRIVRLPNPRQLSGAGRNVGILQSRGEAVLFVDGHCRIENPTLLLELARIMAATGADCLCRPQPLDMAGNSRLQQAIAAVRSSTLGHGPDSTIYNTRAAGWVNPTSSGAAYRREVFRRIGLYNESFDACEDVDLNYRVFRAGMRSYISPRLAVSYRPRDSLRGLWRQMIRYGRGRYRFVREHPSALSVGMLVPPAWLLWLAAASVGAHFWSGFGWAAMGTLMAYFGLVFLSSAWLGLRKGWRSMALAPLIYAIIHGGLGTGFLLEAAEQVLKGSKRRQQYLGMERREGPTVPTLTMVAAPMTGSESRGSNLEA